MPRARFLSLHVPSLAPTLAAAALAFVGATGVAVAQDAFEPNDLCVDAMPRPLGLTQGLTLGPDDDFFSTTVAPNSELTVAATDLSAGALDINLFDAGCANLIATSTGASLSYFNCGPAPLSVVIEVPGAAFTDLDYELELTEFTVVDDVLEDNDTCSSGALVAIQTFTTPDLMVTGCDEDYYVARLQRAGVQIQVDLLFDHSQGDIDVELLPFDTVNGCNPAAPFAQGLSTDDNESVGYVNTTNPTMAEAVVIRVFMKNGVGFNDYALSVCFGDVQAFPLVGEQVCSGVTNSTGRPSTLCAVGSNAAADNDLTLYVIDLPTNSVGYFVTAPTRGFAANPGGSLGNLCLDVPGRYSTNVLQTFNGFTNDVLDLTNVPVAGGGSTALVVGDTQLWQFWHRDSSGGMAVSNFSSAIEVTFQ
ncbi:MAG: hypothetical protein AAGI22_16015 [Planctomycetota bacterium]